MVNSNYRVTEYREIDDHTELPEELMVGIGACVLEAFGSHMEPDDITAHARGELVVVVHDQAQDDRVAAFAAADILSPAAKFEDDNLSDVNGCYFAGAAVAGDYQGQGLYHTLNLRRLSLAVERKMPTLFTQTQNPRVQEGITHTMERHEQELGIKTVGINRVVRQAAYGRMLTGTRPVAKELTYDDLDYENGDAAVITWALDYL